VGEKEGKRKKKVEEKRRERTKMMEKRVFDSVVGIGGGDRDRRQRWWVVRFEGKMEKYGGGGWPEVVGGERG